MLVLQRTVDRDPSKSATLIFADDEHTLQARVVHLGTNVSHVWYATRFRSGCFPVRNGDSFRLPIGNRHIRVTIERRGTARVRWHIDAPEDVVITRADAVRQTA